jgi:polysaccharide export outer membrane protein
MLTWVVLLMLAQDTGANLPARPIGPDDLVAVSVYGSPELTRNVRVSGDGTIRLPMLPRPIEVAGLMPAAVEAKIVEALTVAQILVDPAVTVVIAEYHSRPISVAGAVRRPLTFQVTQKTTLLEALTRAEGLNADAGTEILVTRANVVERIAVKDLMEGSDPALNLTLEGGEVVRVPEMGRIFVVGNVRKPGAFRLEYEGGMTVLKALALAEGLSPFSAKEAYIYRRTDSNPALAAQELPVGLRQLMDRKTADVALGPNDILYIPDSRRARNTANVIEKMVSFAAGTASGALILGVNR